MADEAAAAAPAADELDTVAPDQTDVADTKDVKPDTAAPSDPAGVNKSESMVDAVSAALNKGKEPAPPAELKSDPEGKTPPAEEDDDDDVEPPDLSEDEQKQLSPKANRRIRHLVAENKSLQEPANAFRRLETFMQSNGLSKDDAADALDIAASIKRNPQEALKRLRDITYQLSLSLGETLPADLHEEVKTGNISEQRARELAVARAQAEGYKQTVQKTVEQQQAERAQAFQAQVRTTVNTWEASMSTKDPDFARKKPLIEAYFLATVHRQGPIVSVEDAQKRMKSAYKQASNDLRVSQPQRPAITPTSATPTAVSPAAPKTMADAIRQRLGAAA